LPAEGAPVDAAPVDPARAGPQGADLERARAERALQEVRDRLDALQATASWRLTRPIRQGRAAAHRGIALLRAVESRGGRCGRAAASLLASLRRLRAGRRPAVAARRRPPLAPGAAVAPRREPAARLEAAVAGRLDLVSRLLGGGASVTGAVTAEASCARFAAAAATSALPPLTIAWLAGVAGQAAPPLEAELDELGQCLLLDGPDALGRRLAGDLAAAVAEGRASTAELVVVGDRVLVDVTDLADLTDPREAVGDRRRPAGPQTTGLPAFVADAVAHWRERHGAVPVAWDDADGSLGLVGADRLGQVGRAAVGRATVVLPWRSTIILPTVIGAAPRPDRYRALARSGVARLTGIGYDLLAVTASETIPPPQVESFIDHLGVVRHMARVVAVSESAARQFRGFATMVGAEGLAGPQVSACLPPSEAPPVDEAAVARLRAELRPASAPGARGAPDAPGAPVVLVVAGAAEGPTNAAGALAVAERLWAEGRAFELLLAGRTGGDDAALDAVAAAALDAAAAALDALAAELAARGRPLRVLERSDPQTLWAAHRVAQFAVVLPLVEEPASAVARSLACGTPVVTSSFGSTAEVAAGGGALLVDPHDLDDVRRAMAALLDDDGPLDGLRRQAAGRPRRTAEAYAEESWAFLTA
jgi:hypothetical protein